MKRGNKKERKRDLYICLVRESTGSTLQIDTHICPRPDGTPFSDEEMCELVSNYVRRFYAKHGWKLDNFWVLG